MGSDSSTESGAEPEANPRGPERKAVLLRLDPAVHSALQRWAADELRSVNAQVEMVLRDALRKAGRAPRDAGPVPKRGRPPKNPEE
ncbi:toxin-antitoxin system HicB family antitoxin [Nocardioides renjunii]|uniref:toxin-antitoxin system HicB family antitoxin n=1 Tax=Nocardioides renjunii TaxID=3095075 RepID=UPI002AFDF833|nr:toxin-antitoxin system HicB family antitoxin [Nocardioides sp. S-34]WQQ21667.1 toxin-antitoxin system HicB family antitoxin [Nocardioides sp. S-34]